MGKFERSQAKLKNLERRVFSTLEEHPSEVVEIDHLSKYFYDTLREKLEKDYFVKGSVNLSGNKESKDERKNRYILHILGPREEVTRGGTVEKLNGLLEVIKNEELGCSLSDTEKEFLENMKYLQHCCGRLFREFTRKYNDINLQKNPPFEEYSN
ncbi:hypothetical protein K0A97_01315 [Patescibacteria group bacterium]|nr:hypothetical protein [Patescibacteria group bacterium]